MLHTFPPREVILGARKAAKPYMQPTDLPFAVVAEGVLTDWQCDDILADAKTLDPLKLHICEATTRECYWPLAHVYKPILSYAEMINGIFWDYDVNFRDAAGFHQTYEAGGKYQLHMDGQVGQMRKLTAVAMLSDPDTYEGGDLVLHYHPNKFKVPRTRGTIVIFMSWMLHEVTEVTSGNRQTINLGFWGPNFR